jgi:hypothetical protein
LSLPARAVGVQLTGVRSYSPWPGQARTRCRRTLRGRFSLARHNTTRPQILTCTTRSEALHDAHGGAQHRSGLHARRRCRGLHEVARIHPGLQRAFSGEDLAERGHPLLLAHHLGDLRLAGPTSASTAMASASSSSLALEPEQKATTTSTTSLARGLRRMVGRGGEGDGGARCRDGGVENGRRRAGDGKKRGKKKFRWLTNGPHLRVQLPSHLFIRHR